jgi:hypothetical protein
MFIPTLLLQYYTVSTGNFIAVYAAVFSAFKWPPAFFTRPLPAITAASLATDVATKQR